MSNSLAKAVRSGGITQQEARLTWLLLGFTWWTNTTGSAQGLAFSVVWRVTPTHFFFFLHQHSNFLLGQYGSNGRRGSHFFLLFWTGSVICRSRCRLLKLNQLYWTLIKYSCHFYAAKISMTTTELLSMNRRVRSAFIGKRSTQKQCWWAWNLSRKAISTHCTLL